MPDGCDRVWPRGPRIGDGAGDRGGIGREADPCRPWIARGSKPTTLRAVPRGTRRNFTSYGQDLILEEATDFARDLVCDPQTSGGLLVSVAPNAEAEVRAALTKEGLHAEPMEPWSPGRPGGCASGADSQVVQRVRAVTQPPELQCAAGFRRAGSSTQPVRAARRRAPATEQRQPWRRRPSSTEGCAGRTVESPG